MRPAEQCGPQALDAVSTPDAMLATLRIDMAWGPLTPDLGTGCRLRLVKQKRPPVLTFGQVAKAADAGVETLGEIEGKIGPPTRSRP